MKPGTILGDQYEVLEKLGEGGVGIIYRARDTKLDRLVAIKTLSPHLHFDEEAKRRFIQEARAASALDHPYICTIHDIGDTPSGQVFVVMHYYAGHTLKHMLEESAFDVDRTLEIGIQLASALERAHEAGIIHRDLKPANIQITERGEAKLLDFGIAKLASGEKLTQTGVPIGTVGYSSPEQLDAVHIDHRTDLWSLGVVLYEMLVGSNPFRRTSGIATTSAVVNDDPEPLGELRPDAPPELVQLVEACVAKAADDRPPDAATVRRGLEQVRAQRAAGGTIPSAPDPGARLDLIAIVGAVVVIVGALAAFLMLR